MNFAKKLAVDIGLCAFLLLPTLVIAVVVNISRPDCVTCGSNIGLTFWMACIAALQPVVWVQNLSKAKRFGIWSAALIAGVVAYVVFEGFALLALKAGFVAAALILGFSANLIGVFSALVFSLLAVRRTQRGGQISAPVGKPS